MRNNRLRTHTLERDLSLSLSLSLVYSCSNSQQLPRLRLNGKRIHTYTRARGSNSRRHEGKRETERNSSARVQRTLVERRKNERMKRGAVSSLSEIPNSERSERTRWYSPLMRKSRARDASASARSVQKLSFKFAGRARVCAYMRNAEIRAARACVCVIQWCALHVGGRAVSKRVRRDVLELCKLRGRKNGPKERRADSAAQICSFLFFFA